MVGVPGKSKGCLTCRRRKIRCDQNKPNCKKCTDSGRTCEGYETFPTFLISTPEGRQKRHHLAEAKPRSENGDISSVSSPREPPSRRTSVQSNSNSTTSTAVVPFSRQPRIQDIHDFQLISKFWYKYVPANTSANSPSPAPWLEQMLLYTNAGPALSSSMKAFALTRLGWLANDQNLIRRGRQQYGLALSRIRKDLQSEDHVRLDDTLACTHCLSLYELYESTDIKAWNNHISGLGALIRLRGPEAYTSELSRATLYGYAYSAMVHCLQFRKSTFLNSEEWRTIPWKHHQKDFQYRLFEYGFELGACIEEADQKRATNTYLLAEALTGLHNLHDIFVRMDDWLEEFLLENPNAIPSSPYPQTLVFTSLRIAIAILFYWAIKAILTYFVELIGMNLMIHRPEARSMAYIWRDLSAGEILDIHSQSRCVEFCTNIVRTMEYINRDDMGLMAAQQAIFPIRVALFYLKQRGGPEAEWCQDVYDQVVEKKGLRYAKALSQSDGGYGRDRKPVEVANGMASQG